MAVQGQGGTAGRVASYGAVLRGIEAITRPAQAVTLDEAVQMLRDVNMLAQLGLYEEGQ